MTLISRLLKLKEAKQQYINEIAYNQIQNGYLFKTDL